MFITHISVKALDIILTSFILMILRKIISLLLIGYLANLWLTLNVVDFAHRFGEISIKLSLIRYGISFWNIDLSTWWIRVAGCLILTVMIVILWNIKLVMNSGLRRLLHLTYQVLTFVSRFNVDWFFVLTAIKMLGQLVELSCALTYSFLISLCKYSVRIRLKLTLIVLFIDISVKGFDSVLIYLLLLIQNLNILFIHTRLLAYIRVLLLCKFALEP